MVSGAAEATTVSLAARKEKEKEKKEKYQPHLAVTVAIKDETYNVYLAVFIRLGSTFYQYGPASYWRRIDVAPI